jgi:hypothetical protein
MWRAVALLVTISSIAVADNKSADPDPGSFDIEPPLLIPNRDGERFGTSKSSPDSAPELDLAKLEKQFQRANRNISGLDRLLRMGALSKLEVEQRRLRMIHLESDLANARLIAAKQQMLQKDKQAGAGEIAKADVSPTENNLALAIEAAHAAMSKREQAEIDAAQANVQRQQKLFALGSARKSDIARAEQKLADLRAQRN